MDGETLYISSDDEDSQLSPVGYVEKLSTLIPAVKRKLKSGDFTSIKKEEVEALKQRVREKYRKQQTVRFAEGPPSVRSVFGNNRITSLAKRMLTAAPSTRGPVTSAAPPSPVVYQTSPASTTVTSPSTTFASAPSTIVAPAPSTATEAVSAQQTLVSTTNAPAATEGFARITPLNVSEPVRNWERVSQHLPL